jgi:hypothetical protein
MTTFMTDRSLVNQVRRCGSAAAPTPRSRLDANPIFRVSLEVEKAVFLNSKNKTWGTFEEKISHWLVFRHVTSRL